MRRNKVGIVSELNPPLKTSHITYLVDDSLVDEIDFNGDYPPMSLAFCCATCGNVWARTIVGDGDGWLFEVVPCDKHRPRGVFDLSRIPGSLLSRFLSTEHVGMNEWAGTIEVLPHHALVREFLLRSKHCE